jgi:hypothetical protein
MVVLASLSRSPYFMIDKLFFLFEIVKTVSLLTIENSGLILAAIMSKQALSEAIQMAGGQAHLGRGIRERIPGSKIGQVHVWGWMNSVRMEVPPPEAVIPICDFLDWRMTPHRLRPDLYPNPSDAIPPEVTVGAGDTASERLAA